MPKQMSMFPVARAEALEKIARTLSDIERVKATKREAVLAYNDELKMLEGKLSIYRMELSETDDENVVPMAVNES